MGIMSSNPLNPSWAALKKVSTKSKFQNRVEWLNRSNKGRSPINFDLSQTGLDCEEMEEIAQFMKDHKDFFVSTVTINLTGVDFTMKTGHRILYSAPEGMWQVTVSSNLSTEIASSMIPRLPGGHCKLVLEGPLPWMSYAHICRRVYPSRKFHGTTFSRPASSISAGHAGTGSCFSVNRNSTRWFPAHIFILKLLGLRYSHSDAYWMLPFDLMSVLLDFVTPVDSCLNKFMGESLVPEVAEISEGFMIHNEKDDTYVAVMDCTDELSERISQASFMVSYSGVSVSFDSSLFSGEVSSWEGDRGEVNSRVVMKSHPSQPTPAIGSTVQYYIQPYGTGLLAPGKVLVATSRFETTLSRFVVGTRTITPRDCTNKVHVE